MQESEFLEISQVKEKPITFNLAGILTGVKKGIPFAISVFAYGLFFGVLARQAGLTLEESLLMSGLVFAGAAQFVALGLWVEPLPVGAIIFTTLVVNLRHLLMGAALSPLLLRLPRGIAYGSLFFMADESWALAMSEFAKGNHNAAVLLGSGLAVFTAWLSATFFGRTVGSILQDPSRWGLDFAFTAVFIGLLVGLWKGKSDLLPWCAAALVSIAAAAWLPGKWHILLGGLAGTLVGGMRNAD